MSYKIAAIYFHRDYGKEALDLQLRIRSDTGQEQNEPVYASITEGQMIRTLNDVAAVDAVLIDVALGADAIKRILELQDAHKRPYEVHRIQVSLKTSVYEFVTEKPDGNSNAQNDAPAVRGSDAAAQPSAA